VPPAKWYRVWVRLSGVVAVSLPTIACLLGVAVLGWIAGMWTFRRSEKWCPVHGTKLTCAHCPHQPVPVGRL